MELRMNMLYALCLAVSVGLAPSVFADPHEASGHTKESANKKEQEKKVRNLCDKKARLAPTSYSAKTIKKACLKEGGIKKSR